MTLHRAKPEHEVAYQDIVALINRHAAKLTALELLAIGANLIGKLIALQDQRITTPEIAIAVVAENIEYGNQQARAQFDQTKGSA